MILTNSFDSFDRSMKLGKISLSSEAKFDDEFRVTALYTTVQLLASYLTLWSEYPAAIEIFTPIKKSLETLPVEKYPDCVKTSIESLNNKIGHLETLPRKRLLQDAKRPKILRLYEPAIEET